MSKRRSRNKHSQTVDPLLNIPEEELDIYITTSLTTPPDIDKYVLRFCKKLSSKETPVFLTIQPPNWSRLHYCNKNVEKMMQLHGGDMVLGYKIWYVPALYIEAERHAVWLNPEGELTDITFNKDGENNIPFLPAQNLRTVVANAATKPREAFHSRIENFIQRQVQAEQFKSLFSKKDDTWDGWEKAKSFESDSNQKE